MSKVKTKSYKETLVVEIDTRVAVRKIKYATALALKLKSALADLNKEISKFK